MINKNHLLSLPLRTEVIVILGIFILSLGIRLIFSAPHTLVPDSTLYLGLAEQLGEGSWVLDGPVHYNNLIQPGYSMVIWLWNIVLQNVVVAGITVSLLAGALLPIMVYGLGRVLFNYQTGLLAGALVAIHPLTFYFSSSVLTESLFTLLFIAGIIATWKLYISRPPYWWYILVGVLIGFTYLTRVIGLSMLFIAILWIIIRHFRKPGFNWKRTVSSILLLVAGTAIIIVPFLVFLYQETETIVISGAQQHVVVAKGVEEGTQAIHKHKAYYGLAENNADYFINQASNQPYSIGMMISTYWESFNRFFVINIRNAALFFWLYITFLAAALYFLNTKQQKEKLFFVISWIPLYLVLFTISEIYLRYYFPIIILLIVPVAYGIHMAAKHFIKNKRLSIAMVVVMAIFFIAYEGVVAVDRGYPFTVGWKYSTTDRESFGKHITEQYGDGLRILSTDAVLIYHANATYFPIPVAEYNAVVQFAQSNSIDLMILGRSRDSTIRPALNNLYTDSGSGFDLIDQEGDWYVFRLAD